MMSHVREPIKFVVSLAFVSAVVYCVLLSYGHERLFRPVAVIPVAYRPFTVKVVTSVFEDWDIANDWLHKVEPLSTPNITYDYIVYEKNTTMVAGDYSFLNKHLAHLPNLGRCDYAFFFHVVHFYDRLDDATVFCKVNWQRDAIPLWKLLQYAPSFDFSEGVGGGSHGLSRRYQIWDKRYVGEFGHLGENIYVSYDDVDPVHERNVVWYKQLYGNLSEPATVQSWGHGPCFSASRRLLRRHPRAVYESFMRKFWPTESWDTEKMKQREGHNLEQQIYHLGKRYHDHLLRFWRIFFTHGLPAEHSEFRVRPAVTSDARDGLPLIAAAE